MLYKNNKEWDYIEWKKLLPDSVIKKFEKQKFIQFRMIGFSVRTFEGGEEKRIYSSYTSAMECTLKINSQKCTINSGIQQHLGGESFSYIHEGIQILDGECSVDNLEDIFVMIHHPRFQTDEDTEDVCKDDIGKEGRHIFRMEDIEKVSKNKFVSDKEITNLCARIYDMEEDQIRGMYINEGFGDVETETSSNDIYNYFIAQAKKNYKGTYDKFYSADDNSIAVLVKTAVKKEKLNYSAKTGMWKLGMSKESFFIVPEGNREVAKATISLIEYLKNATDQTILAELKIKK